MGARRTQGRHGAAQVRALGPRLPTCHGAKPARLSSAAPPRSPRVTRFSRSASLGMGRESRVRLRFSLRCDRVALGGHRAALKSSERRHVRPVCPWRAARPGEEQAAIVIHWTVHRGVVGWRRKSVGLEAQSLSDS